jgi:hypothetical protein
MFSLVVLSFYMLLSYQNCGQNMKYSEALTPVDVNSPADAFVEKLMTDVDTIEAELKIGPNCKAELPVCIAQDRKDLSCIKETVEAYYDSLQCMGFTVTSDDQCILAVSDVNPKAMQPILVDMTCFNDQNRNNKALELGACHAEEIGFNKDAPSTGMRISSWMDLGNEYPFSRNMKQILVYPAQEEGITIAAYEMNENGKDLKDHCGKTRRVIPTGAQLSINLPE